MEERINRSPNIKLPEAVPYNVDLREHTEEDV